MKPDLLAKTIIIIELANKVAKLQYYKICHTDLHVQNIIWDKNNSAAWIIDFGNAFSFENMKCIRS
jgi:tRNA A-37 threonylcarbamoyl transferase component Bud32